MWANSSEPMSTKTIMNILMEMMCQDTSISSTEGQPDIDILRGRMR